MPYMLGGIFGAACFVLWYERGGRRLPQVTRWVRLVFMSMIGAMIGSRFSPDILLYIPTALPAFMQLLIFFTRHEISVIEVSTFDLLLLHYSFTCGRGDRG